MKQLKRVLTIIFVIFDIILITGGYDQHSRMYRWIGHPLADIMTSIANFVGGTNGIGWAIIIITAVLRLILLPFFLNQQKASTINQIKMQQLKPEIDKLQAITRKAGTQQEQQQASMAMMSLYRENNVSLTGGISFLTMAMQVPVFSGLYSAILHSPSLRDATFFGFNLNQSQIVFSVIAGLIYLAQAWLMAKHLPEEQRKASSAMMYISPIMIFAFSMYASGAIGLYFIVGGIFLLFQSAINHLQRPAMEEKVSKEFKVEKTAEDLLQSAAKKAPVTQPNSDVNEEQEDHTTPTNNKHGRNSGKQNRNQNKDN